MKNWKIIPPNTEQETVLFTLIGIEMLLIYAKTLKHFERAILLRRKLIYLERLGELYLTEDEEREKRREAEEKS